MNRFLAIAVVLGLGCNRGVDRTPPGGDPPRRSGDRVDNGDVSPTDTDGDALAGDPICTDCWRSALYPEDWQPGTSNGEGRSLPDFSWAGYHNGEEPVPETVTGDFVDAVADHGADDTGLTDATAAIQAAIDAAAAAGANVLLPEGTYRCDGSLLVESSNLVIRGAGPESTRVFFTSNLTSGGSHLRFAGDVQQEADLPLVEDGVRGEHHVSVDDASSLAVGDDISIGWVITPEFVEEHGMTGTWTAFNGQWKPFFRRQVVAIHTGVTPHQVLIDAPLRYPTKMRDQASLRRETGYLEEVGIEALAISNAVSWDDAWARDRVHAIAMVEVKDAWISRVHSFDSTFGEGDDHLQSGGILVQSSKRVTITDVELRAAQNRGGGGNGYLVEIMKSNEILVRDTVALDGRHNFIQNWDFGTSGCVFLRCHSAGGRTMSGPDDVAAPPGYCEYHHSLAMANLVDASVIEDGWFGGNRLTMSTGAGHTTTDSVYWNLTGGGLITSMAYGWGYIIGTSDIAVLTTTALPQGQGTEPEDWVENQAGPLAPASLYEDQLRRRLQ